VCGPVAGRAGQEFVLYESGRALPHSKTWPWLEIPMRRLRFWSAALLRRFLIATGFPRKLQPLGCTEKGET
jgi:hypothetical protein